MSPWNYARTLMLGSCLALPSLLAGPITAEVQRTPHEGYFRVTLELGSAPGPVPALVARVDQGDAFLIHLSRPGPAPVVAAEADDDEDSAATPAPTPAKAGSLIMVGRFLRPGPVRITLLSRVPTGPPVPWKTLDIQIPASSTGHPELRAQWLQLQQQKLRRADPAASEPLTRAWLASARNGGTLAESWQGQGRDRDRPEPPDLYSLFTGAAAIQESLQLDLMRPARRDPKASQATVALSELQGPEVKSHPFEAMLEGRQPKLPSLARYIPADQYALFFRSINQQTELMDLLDEWGGNLLRQIEPSSRDYRVRANLSQQLCLQTTGMTRLFGDTVVAEMAFTGQDPFLKEGTAFTVLLALKNRDRFLGQIDQSYAAAARLGARRSSFSIDGKPGLAVVSADRKASSYTLLLGDVAIVSTSRKALERILAATARPAESLAQAKDLHYMRTIFPEGAAEEDAFLYLSDAHIRALVGPRWKIGEARRLRCSAKLALLANARQWFLAEYRHEPTLEELVSRGYVPAGQDCPDHGQYRLDPHGVPVCTVHQRLGWLTPLAEIAMDRVSAEEAEQYRGFVTDYNRYWSKFFDPIGIRIKLGDTLRIQTCILPLIENSWYDGLVAMTGQTPGPLADSLILPRTVLSLRAHLAPEWLAATRQMLRAGPAFSDIEGWLGDEISLNLCDGQVLFTLGEVGRELLPGARRGSPSLTPLIAGYFISAFNLPTYLSLKVTDPKRAQAALPTLFQSLVPHRSGGELQMETYLLDDRQDPRIHVLDLNILIKLRLYLAVVGDQLVIASRRDILTDLLAAGTKPATPAAPAAPANLSLLVQRSAFQQLEETVQLGFQEQQRGACRQNLPLAAVMIQVLGVPSEQLADSVFALRGYQPACPSGGHYLEDPQTGELICSVHGNERRPRQPLEGNPASATFQLVNSLERVDLRLGLSAEGLMSTLALQRKHK